MISIRPAEPADVDFLVELLNDDDVEPFLAAVRAKTRDDLLAEIERARAEPDAFGRLVVEVDGEPAGAMGWERANARSRIAHLGGLAVHPRFRGRGVADEAARQLQRHLILERGFHRLQLECYGFNERAIRHAERAGFVREGVKRKAYWRHGEWVDGILFGLVREDLEDAWDRRMAKYLHTMVRITDVDRSRAFYEALGMELRRDLPIVRGGELEATNYFFAFPGDEAELELTLNHDGRGYELGTAYGHVAIGVDDLDETLARLGEQGIEPEREPYRVREGGSRLCFVRDPDGYRIEIIDRSGR